MNVNGVTPAPAVYLSPQVWAPLSPGDMPIALALAARPAPKETEEATKDEAKQKAAEEVQRVTMHPAKPVSTVDLTGEGRHVDLYV